MPSALTQRQIAQYLVQRSLVDEASIVAGNLRIVDASRRNCNYLVFSNRNPCYLIKQGMSPDRIASVAHEAGIYDLWQHHAQVPKRELQRYLPRFYGYDPNEQILILQLLPGAEDLRQHHIRTGRFSATLASLTGDALGFFHSLKQRPQDGSWFSGRPPWVLTIHRPHLSVFWDASDAKLQLIRIIQNSDGFCQSLDELRNDWKADRLIHGDVKWDNWVTFAHSGSARMVNLVDWELATLGDPCWDIGSALSDYLSFWLSSIPITGEDPPDRFLELSRYPLERMQPAIRSLWVSYVGRMGLHGSAADQWLLRAVRYSAARLVQTALEQMQVSNAITGNIICVLQLALNIMKRPREASVLLFGIPLE